MQTDLEKRKEYLLSFTKSHIYHILTAFAILIGAFIRTRNLSLLKDKLLLALDPYVFYRYTKHIVEHGSLMAHDTMRYVPLGFNPTGTGSLLSYILAYFYKFIHIFIPSLTLEKFNILYPVIAFIFAMVIFFLLVKRLFNIKIATLATAFLAVLPGFLYRTTAGFSEKEPIGIFLIFLVFYFYILAFQTKTIKRGVIYGVLSGIFSGLLTMIWGGASLIFLLIPAFSLTIFAINKLNEKKFCIYSSWFITIITFALLIKKIPISSLFTSLSTLLTIFAFFTFLIDFLIFNLDIFKLKENLEKRFPSKVISLIMSLLLSIVVTSIMFSPTFFVRIISHITEKLIHPMGTSRFVLTVAEAHQPYFVNWRSDYHWFFHIFFLGSILLFYNLVKPLWRHYKWFLTTVYALFISSFIFSRYSQNSILNGENFISKFLYIGSLVAFVVIMFGLIIYFFYKNKELYNKLKQLNTNYIFVFIWFLLTIVGARGAMRLFFVFAPTTAILGSYFVVKVFYYIKNLKIKVPYNIILAGVFLVLILIAPVNGSFYTLTKISYNSVKHTGPSFDNQWERAMNWVKQNTQEDAVFAHWWDYGYWVQTMGERATILDGGNAITYWNHLMGRHVLTGHSPKEALEFLKSHNATHLLIIGDEIGKYPAYSSIGSDENYDRYSYLPTFSSSPQDTRETRNETLYLYKGQFVFDDDFVYNDKIFSKSSTVIAGFIIPMQHISQNKININQPTAVVINNGQRTNIPLECVYFNNEEINYDISGIKGCLQLIPKYNVNTKQVDYVSMAIYLSEKVRKTLFTQMFLFNKQWDGFELVYDDSQTGWPLMYIENFGRMVGPLKIWKINYPSEIKINPDYLKTSYPSPELQKSR